MRRTKFAWVLMGLFAAAATRAAADQNIAEFNTMFAVSGPFLSNANPVRGVDGGGLPWVLDGAHGRLDMDGKLDVQVRGLVIPESIGFGFNPAPFFRFLVSCLSVDAGGQVSIVNVATQNGAEVMLGDPKKGSARFAGRVSLPTPCVAPIVFVTSPTGAWFAVSGR